MSNRLRGEGEGDSVSEEETLTPIYSVRDIQMDEKQIYYDSNTFPAEKIEKDRVHIQKMTKSLKLRVTTQDIFVIFFMK